MLLNIILEKLDRETRKQYELTLKDNDIPNFDEFLEFLERLCQVLSNVSTNILTKAERSKSFVVKSNNKAQQCIACKNKTHPLYHCDKFKDMKLEDSQSG